MNEEFEKWWMADQDPGLEYDNFDLGELACIAGIAKRCWTAATAVAQAEIAGMREPGPCGLHPRACWVNPPEAKSLSESRRFALQGGHCTVCVALRAKDEEIARLREVRSGEK
jgi:hypothetical protein